MQKLKERASAYLDKKQEEFDESMDKLGVDEYVRGIEELSEEMVTKLANSGVLKTEDLADLSVDECMDLLSGEKVGKSVIETVIMDARKNMGWVQ